MKQRRYLCIFLFLCLALFQFPFNCFSQEETQEANVEETTPQAVDDEKSIFSISFDNINSASELTPLAINISHNHAKLLERIAKFETFLDKIKANIESERQTFDALKGTYDEAINSKNTSQEKFAELASQFTELSFRIEDTATLCSQKAIDINTQKDKWEDIRTKWKEQERRFKSEYKSFKDTFLKVNTDVKEAINGLVDVQKPLLEMQNSILSFQAEIKDIKKELDEKIASFKKDIFKKAHLSFFNPSFWTDFGKDLTQDFYDSFNSLFNFSKGIATSGQISVFVIHIIFLIVFYLGLRRLRKYNQEDEKLRQILEAPFNVSLFISTVFMSFFYGVEINNLFKVILLLASAISGALIINRVLKSKQKKVFFVSLVTIFIIQRLFVIINMPDQINRVFVALASLVVFIILNYKTSIFNFLKLNKIFATSIDNILSNIILISTFLSQIIGYHNLSSFIFDSYIKLLFCIAIAWILTSLLKELAYVLFNFSLFSRVKICNKHTDYFLKRINFLIDFIIYFSSFTYIISSFGFFNSANEAANYILGIGVKVFNVKITLGLVLLSLFVFFTVMFISWLIQRILEEEVYPRKSVQIGVQSSINRIIYYAFVCIGVLLVFSILGFELKNIAVAFGVLGVGIGFGLQNFVNNFVSGLTLLFERPIKIGDCVDVNGQMGIVKKMGLRATVVETTIKSEVIVPNSEIISSKVTNWTFSDRRFAIILEVGVSYGSDVNKVTQILKEIVETQEGVFKTPTPLIMFKEFGDSSLNYMLRIYTTYADMNKVRHEVNTRIFNRFKEEGIEIPFPQRDVNLIGLKEILKDSFGNK